MECEYIGFITKAVLTDVPSKIFSNRSTLMSSDICDIILQYQFPPEHDCKQFQHMILYNLCRNLKYPAKFPDTLSLQHNTIAFSSTEISCATYHRLLFSKNYRLEVSFLTSSLAFQRKLTIRITDFRNLMFIYTPTYHR